MTFVVFERAGSPPTGAVSKKGQNFACQTLQICNNYRIPPGRLGPRLVSAATMKWMKWIGRSLVERAAATTLTRPAQTLCLADKSIAAQLSAGDQAVEINVRTEKFQRLLRMRGNGSLSQLAIQVNRLLDEIRRGERRWPVIRGTRKYPAAKPLSLSTR